MAKIQSIIKPFPDNINQNYFGAWLSGFTDGEGSFILAWRNKEQTNGYARFSFCMRQDEREILETIRSFWKFGDLYWSPGRGKVFGRTTNQKPQLNFVITKLSILKNVVVSHFDKYPLMAKKSRDFTIWKQGVSFLVAISKRSRIRPIGRGGLTPTWNNTDKIEFQKLVSAINEQRKFEPQIIKINGHKNNNPKFKQMQMFKEHDTREA